MEAPIHIGASLVDAPPGKPGGADVPTDDRTVLTAVRRGDMDAFGALYSRHVAAVRRLARRLAIDRYEADDIVSEVFANTLRAIRNGRGPRDDAQAYLLRSVRHTAGKLRSRKDTGRSEPVPIDRLDRPVTADLHLQSDIEIALSHLPNRHREVLWATCVEGRPAREVATDNGLDASCVTSLTLRARRALGRSYLLQRTARPESTSECRRIRSSMPGCLRDEVSATTVAAVHEHIDDCAACCEVYEEMGRLDRNMCSVTLIGLLVAVVRGWLRFGAPIAATFARPLVSTMIAGAVVAGAITTLAPVRDVDPTEEVESDTSGTSTASGSLLVDPIARAATAEVRAPTGLRPTDEVTPAMPHAAGIADSTLDDVLHPNDLPTRPTTAPPIDGGVAPPPVPNDPAENDPDPELVAAVDDALTGTVDATQQLLTSVTGTVSETVTHVGAAANTIITETVATVSQTVDVVLDEMLATVTPPGSPDATPPTGLGETVTDLTDGAVDSVFGVDGGGLVLFRN